MICITPAWGFIVVYLTKLKNGNLSHGIHVYNINGRRLRKRRLDFAIANWCVWTSMKGFDYMIVSDPRGKLRAFEVFYCDVKKSFFRCHSPVSSLTYLVDLGAVIAVTQNGKILFVPQSIDGKIRNVS
jgi:hypothetical protein